MKAKPQKTKNIGLIAGLVSIGIFTFLTLAAWLCYLQYLKRKDTVHKQEHIKMQRSLLTKTWTMSSRRGPGLGDSVTANCRRRHGDSPTRRSSARAALGQSTESSCTIKGSMWPSKGSPKRGDKGVHLGGNHHQPAQASQPFPARRVVP